MHAMMYRYERTANHNDLAAVFLLLLIRYIGFAIWILLVCVMVVRWHTAGRSFDHFRDAMDGIHRFLLDLLMAFAFILTLVVSSTDYFSKTLVDGRHRWLLTTKSLVPDSCMLSMSVSVYDTQKNWEWLMLRKGAARR